MTNDRSNTSFKVLYRKNGRNIMEVDESRLIESGKKVIDNLGK